MLFLLLGDEDTIVNKTKSLLFWSFHSVGEMKPEIHGQIDMSDSDGCCEEKEKVRHRE